MPGGFRPDRRHRSRSCSPWGRWRGSVGPGRRRYHIILNSKNKAICIIQITKVYVAKFKEISKEHAYKEGEGDKSLCYWKRSHKDFFTMCMAEINKKFSEDMKVVCEEFEVVFK